ncbi:MAG: hypothetical protein OEY19_07970 [Gammaproteobacteria bacterium]|nr:hypothetical protein [Gammaproteobacteria bacterium]MDH5629802.1 hypothetical protein [Gammaproteobacteria bacterium]
MKIINPIAATHSQHKEQYNFQRTNQQAIADSESGHDAISSNDSYYRYLPQKVNPVLADSLQLRVLDNNSTRTDDYKVSAQGRKAHKAYSNTEVIIERELLNTYLGVDIYV